MHSFMDSMLILALVKLDPNSFCLKIEASLNGSERTRSLMSSRLDGAESVVEIFSS